ncbi:acetyl/propionyl/methylcrotonyl-CoA carboxylase subunit alpha [Nakamurella sp.]|uniref:acetyl/propionyl/methylcrotonyl-CoA carboxylase subunit alpha n=1 Tax=Nakamurella sp. TaxID=1869182 RepID=UPI003B3AE4B3
MITPLRTLLIANRGEIALRVMRTARRMGVRTVAIYTEADRSGPHVRAADAARPVPGYLDIEAVVAAARDAGADAIHPGYGFLSERAAFARAVEDAGLILVGPPAAVIEAMGRKDAAREIAVAAGVPVVPRGEDAGYPVLVKAAAGGGGKGMRIVRRAQDLDEAMAAARREARSAFGDDTLLVERYVERGRHIEVQIMADAHGTVLHLHERDCSPQRRHQKVLEEAPAPTIDPAVRALVTSGAVALAAHVGYRNAGTVEFLVDDDSGQAYFLEMNTRLQVEHPVTEAITGLDLVELQLRVAAGEPLALTQADVTATGHAIEARVYAEDSFHGFLPQAGTASVVRWPAGVRVDHALESGQAVGTSFDPMLGKIIAHGPDRETARRRLLDALDATVILGLTTNTGFLRALAGGPEFRAAAIDTAWLDRNPVPEPAPDGPRIFAAWAAAAAAAAADDGPFRADGWRSGADPAPTIVELDRTVTVDRAAGRVDGRPVREISCAQGRLELELDGTAVSAFVDVRAGATEVAHRGQRFVFTRPDVFGEHVPSAGDGVLTAPMPGTVIDVRVADGDDVDAGQPLLVLEAMKMELAVKAPFAGTVAGLTVAVGTRIGLGAALVQVVPAAGPADGAGGAVGERPITAG